MRHTILSLMVLAAGMASTAYADAPRPSQQGGATQGAAVGGTTSGPPKELTLDLGGGVILELVLIPAGKFVMGSPKDLIEAELRVHVIDSPANRIYKGNIPGEGPQHLVRITRPFYLGKCLVTQEQWQAVMGNNPSCYKGAKNPVESVSWDDCQQFLDKLNARFRRRHPSPLPAGQGEFRLPSEAQWEYACRAGSTTRYCYGDEESEFGEYAWYKENSDSKTHPVGQKRPNGWGLYDMHGNVREWCQDWYDPNYYVNSLTDDPAGPTAGSSRVIRGGSWSGAASLCRSARRSGNSSGLRDGRLGLRVSFVLRDTSIVAKGRPKEPEVQTTSPRPLAKKDATRPVEIEPSVAGTSSSNPSKTPPSTEKTNERVAEVIGAEDTDSDDLTQGIAQWKKGDFDSAVACVTKAIQKQPHEAKPMLTRGMVYYDKNDLKKAIADFTRVLQNHRKNSQALSGRARCYYETGELDKALDDAKHAFKVQPDDAEALTIGGLIFHEREQLDKALSVLNQALQKDPKNIEALFTRGQTYYESDEFAKAIADLTAVLALNPKCAEALHFRGRAYYEQDELDKALPDLSEAIRLEPKDAEALVARGLVYYEQDDLEKAIADYTQASKIDPANAEVLESRAKAYADNGDLDKALADCNQAIRLEAEADDAYACRARVYLAKGDLEKALADCNELIHRDAEDAEAFYLRGSVYAAQKKWPSAIADYTEAIRLNDEYADAYFRRAAAYEETGEPDKAKADHDQVAKLEGE